MLILFVIFMFHIVSAHISLNLYPPTTGFDKHLYEDALDSEECQKQLNYLVRNDSFLLAQFLDAGLRIPRGLLKGNTLDMGNYYQCLEINQSVNDEMDISGKYCVIQTTPRSESRSKRHIPQWLNPVEQVLSENEWKYIEQYEMNNELGNRNMISILSNARLRLALCIPKPCTTREVIDGLLFNFTSVGFQYEDNFCRLPNDKPWVTGDTVAVTILGLIGFLTIISTTYDIVISRKSEDSKRANEILQSFSVIKNSKTFFAISSKPGSLECVDGIRALAMLWVLLGHSFSSQPFTLNPFEAGQWVSSPKALWVVAGHLAVDTFFMLSGLLAVYCNVGRTNSLGLLKNLHKFYLNRLLRMFPLLALTILFEATLFNHISDGPFWQSVVNNAEICRTYWWSTLLYVQNYLNAENVCVGITWYLAIDVQLHILSPLVLFWVLSGKRKIAWGGLTFALLGSIAAATIYNFIKKFPSSMMTPNRGNEFMYYMIYYYMNTLTRAPPFIVGMVFGYLLHVWRQDKLKISKIINLIIWMLVLAAQSLIIYSSYPIMQMDWDNQTADSLINSFVRPTWALCLGWVIFSCVQGYAVPINWFLSLRMWKIPARLSYALYIMHYSIMVVINASRVAPIYFTVGNIMFYFFGYLALCVFVAIVACILVDLPFSILFRIMLSGGMPKKNNVEPLKPDSTKNDKTLD
ncbi:O-acyltransferase like protein-like [Zerene cesonia]|uniref:O-acyltransferase like protein-like n=1 Tax=Zerene cesonia TaxID=33412 RepID=UPI0018E5666C|nr:O-acyltransferase like protein-like [Zerene cesonia]